MKGVVGVTFTTSHCNNNEDEQQQRQQQSFGAGDAWARPPSSSLLQQQQQQQPGSYFEPPPRTNYNLRGHRSEVGSPYCSQYPSLFHLGFSSFILLFLKWRKDAKNFSAALIMAPLVAG